MGIFITREGFVCNGLGLDCWELGAGLYNEDRSKIHVLAVCVNQWRSGLFDAFNAFLRAAKFYSPVADSSWHTRGWCFDQIMGYHSWESPLLISNFCFVPSAMVARSSDI